MNGQTAAVGAVTTLGGIAGTRRANAALWQAFVGSDPTGDWELQFDDTDRTVAVRERPHPGPGTGLRNAVVWAKTNHLSPFRACC